MQLSEERRSNRFGWAWPAERAMDAAQGETAPPDAYLMPRAGSALSAKALIGDNLLKKWCRLEDSNL
jgi:hypothetical protein